MKAKEQFSIRHLLLSTLVVAFLVATPMSAHRVVLPRLGAGLVWIAYNGLVLATVAYPLWHFSGRGLVVPSIALLCFVVNFGPEVATVADFLITGNNDATGSWLAERGLDYDPLLSIPCWCSIASSG